MTDLFSDPPVADRTTLARRPTWEQYLRERYALPADWKWFKFVKFGGSKDNGWKSAGMMVTGAVVRDVYSRGPRKGTPHWGKRLRETEMTLPVLNDDLDAWRAQWERETGLCVECEGTGNEWSGWNHVEGDRYRTCRKCHGTGTASGIVTEGGDANGGSGERSEVEPARTPLPNVGITSGTSHE